MSPEITLLIGLASGLFALIGALGSQIITAYANLKAKRIELVYTRKLDAYKDVLQKCFALFREYEKKEKYDELNESIMLAATIASKEIYAIFSRYNKGILQITDELLDAVNRSDKSLIEDKRGDLAAIVDNLANLIREDLKRFSGK